MLSLLPVQKHTNIIRKWSVSLHSDSHFCSFKIRNLKKTVKSLQHNALTSNATKSLQQKSECEILAEGKGKDKLYAEVKSSSNIDFSPVFKGIIGTSFTWVEDIFLTNRGRNTNTSKQTLMWWCNWNVSVKLWGRTILDKSRCFST